MDESQRLLKRMKYDRQSFNEFYEKYYLFVFQIALHITGNKADAEDVCHDVFIEIYQKGEEYDPKRGSVKAWLAIKTKSRSLDRIRRKKLILVDKLEHINHQKVNGAETEFLLKNEKEILYEALNHLPEEQKKAIVESYFYGKSHIEIASSMEKPLGTVKSMIRYGLNKLRRQKSFLAEFGPLRGGKHNDL